MGSRSLASAVVGSAVLATAGYAAITITEQTPTTHSIPASTAGRIVFSVRNDGSATLTINDFQQQAMLAVNGTVGACAGFGQIVPIGMASPMPVMIPPGEQAQFQSDLTSPASGSAACTYDIRDPMTQTIGTVTLQAVVGTDETDLQPRVMRFVPKAQPSETQRVSLFNYTGNTLGAMNYSLQIVGMNPGWLSFVDANCDTTTPQTCKPKFSLANNTGALITVRCTPVGTGSAGGAILVFGSGSAGMIGQNTWSCSSPPPVPEIQISNKPITISADVMTEGSGSAFVISTMGSGAPETLVSATLSGPPGIYFKGCATPSSCTFATPKPLPTPLAIYCTPPDATTMLQATLQVNGMTSSDTANVLCSPTTTAPWIRVTPPQLDAPDTLVGNMSAVPPGITIENLGDTPLQGVIVTADPNWSIGACTTTMPCMVMKGTPKLVPVQFTPQAHGPISTLASVASNDTVHGTQFVTLEGLGLGSRLELVTPPPGEMISIGPIGRNQLVTRTVTVRDDGNLTIDVAAALSGGMGALTITPPLAAGVGSGSDATFTVSCKSGSAGTFTGSAALSSTQVYDGSPISLPVECDVAATDLNVTPSEFDFGEVRIGSAAKMFEVDILNPGPDASLDITGVTLAGSRPGLKLDNGFLGTSHGLGSGQLLDPKPVVRLTPQAETDLTGVSFNVTVDGETLMYPVKGKVVKAASYVTPAHLDLGTICVGSPTTGVEMLVNSGTATLAVKSPVMMPSQQFTAQSSLPAPLGAGEHADVQIKPQTTTPGTLHAVLTLEDDVPSKYDIPVDATIIDTGTAISPSALSFGTIHAGNTSPPLSITLENCGLEPAAISIGKVAASDGAASAWQISPGTGFTRVLGSHETQEIAVVFAPRAVGEYSAQLQLDVNGDREIVMLVGHGGGDQLADTSFYACGNCSTGSPLGLVPLVGAVGFMLVRRRRGSS